MPSYLFLFASFAFLASSTKASFDLTLTAYDDAACTKLRTNGTILYGKNAGGTNANCLVTIQSVGWKFPASTATCTAASTINADLYGDATCTNKAASVATNAKPGKCFPIDLGTTKFFGKYQCGKGKGANEICDVTSGATKTQCKCGTSPDPSMGCKKVKAPAPTPTGGAKNKPKAPTGGAMNKPKAATKTFDLTMTPYDDAACTKVKKAQTIIYTQNAGGTTANCLVSVGAKQSWKYTASTATCTAASTITVDAYLGATCTTKLATITANTKTGKCFSVSLGTTKFWGKYECGKGKLSGGKHAEICKVPTGAKKAQCQKETSSASLSASFGLLSLAAAAVVASLHA